MRLLKTVSLLSLTIITALLVMTLPAVPALAAVGTISITPASGPVGTAVGISGTGFLLGGTYTVTYDATPVLSGTIAAGGVLTATSFSVPVSTAGAHAVAVTTTGGDTSNVATFTVTPRIALSTTSVQIGSPVSVSGTGFHASSTVVIYIDGIATTSLTTATNGSFYITFTVTQSAGGYHTVTATDSFSNTASATYSITGPQITLSNTSVQAGSIITISGNGFGVSSTVTIYIDGIVTTSTITTSSGSFALSLTVPQGAGGYHTITATDSFANTASASYTITRSITLNQSSLSVGGQLVVTGSSFGGSSIVTIYIDGINTSSTYSNTSGSFTASLSVPEGVSGTHAVTATDSFANSASTTYTVIPNVTIRPASFASGSQVSVTGTGFAASSNVTFYLDGAIIKANAATTSSVGSFTLGSFVFTELPGGSHTFQAKDDSNNSATLSFTISPRVTINPQSGLSGANVQVSGNGFGASKTISINFDGVGVVASSNTDAGGSFNASFIVPTTYGGSHSVVVSDGTSSTTASFNVSATADMNPKTGIAGTSVAVSGASFASRSAIIITYDRSTVANTTADFNGAFSATFKVPASATGTHTVIVTDGSRNVSFSFSIEANVTVSPASGNVGTSITITGTGFASGGQITIQYDTNQAGRVAANAAGGFTVVFNAPASRGGNHSIMVSDGTSSIESTFIMESTPPPVPNLLSPQDRARLGIVGGVTPTLSWTSVTDPSGVTYTLQIDTYPDFSSPVLEKTNISGSRYTLTAAEALPYGEYYWRVKAIDGAFNESAWSQPRRLESGLMPLWALIIAVVVVAAVVGGGLYALVHGRARRPKTIPVPEAAMPQVARGRWLTAEAEVAGPPRQLPWRLALPQPTKKAISTEDRARLKVIIDFAQSLPLMEPGYTVNWLVDLMETGMGIHASTPAFEQLLNGELKLSYEPTWIHHPAYQDLTTLLKGQPALKDLHTFIDSVNQCVSEATALLQDIYRDAKTEIPPDFMERGGWGFVSAVYTDSINWFLGKSLRDPLERDYTIKPAGGQGEKAEERWLYGEETTSFAGQLILAHDEKEALQLRELHLKLRRAARKNNRARQVATIVTQLDMRRAQLLSVFSQIGQSRQ